MDRVDVLGISLDTVRTNFERYDLLDDQVRFLVVGVPGTMTGYFAEAGVPVPDEASLPSREPPGPAELGDLPARHGITFFQGDPHQ